MDDSGAAGSERPGRERSRMDWLGLAGIDWWVSALMGMECLRSVGIGMAGIDF